MQLMILLAFTASASSAATATYKLKECASNWTGCGNIATYPTSGQCEAARKDAMKAHPDRRYICM